MNSAKQEQLNEDLHLLNRLLMEQADRNSAGRVVYEVFTTSTATVFTTTGEVPQAESKEMKEKIAIASVYLLMAFFMFMYIYSLILAGNQRNEPTTQHSSCPESMPSRNDAVNQCS